MCSAHYARYRRSGSPVGQQVLRDEAVPWCSVDGCDKPRKARGLCNTHYARLTRAGTLDVRPQRQRGTGTLKDGYVVFVRHVNGRKIHMQEHRLVMEAHLGRALRDDETVHHVNGVKDDNRVENLEVWASRHPKGQRVADLVDFAVSILAQYAPERLVR